MAKYSSECLTSGHRAEELVPGAPRAAFSLLVLSLKGQLSLACPEYLRFFGSMRGHGKAYGKGQEQEEMYIG